MATVQSIIDRVTYITQDSGRVRFGLDEIILAVKDAQISIANAVPRASAEYTTVALRAGTRQDLRLLNASKRWVRLFEVVCNMAAGETPGPTVRLISRSSLDNFDRDWRNAPPSPAVREYSLDEREPFTFDVNPPAQAGARVLVLAAVVPPEIVDEDSDFGLADGYDIPAVDYVCWRLFSKDASDPAYASRAVAHQSAFSGALLLHAKDASE